MLLLNNTRAMWSLPPSPNSSHFDVAFVVITASIGMIGNFAVLICIVLVKSLRHTSNAFLFHHSLLDLAKAAFCILFAKTMMSHMPASRCSLLGGAYVVFVTTSSFNMLALVMNQAYQIQDLLAGITDSTNYCCVFFGVFTIWFGSVIMNLGVAFIPGNPGFDRQMGHCIFLYGITRNYVLHLLWLVLVSMAVFLTFMYLHKLRIDLHIELDKLSSSQGERIRILVRKKLCWLTCLAILFAISWYPLFILTAVDPHFTLPLKLYKTLTILAWSNASITPFIMFCLFKTESCCCRVEFKKTRQRVLERSSTGFTSQTSPSRDHRWRGSYHNTTQDDAVINRHFNSQDNLSRSFDSHPNVAAESQDRSPTLHICNQIQHINNGNKQEQRLHHCWHPIDNAEEDYSTFLLMEKQTQRKTDYEAIEVNSETHELNTLMPSYLEAQNMKREKFEESQSEQADSDVDSIKKCKSISLWI